MAAQPFRLATGGAIDRSRPVSFLWNGTSVPGFEGDTLYSALMANGIGSQPVINEPEAIVEPTARTQNKIQCDIAVVGGGAAGLFAAQAAAAMGANVVLIEEGAHLGGWLLNERRSVDGRPACDWVRDLSVSVCSDRNVTALLETTAIPDAAGRIAAGSGEAASGRIFIEPRRTIVATGAREQTLTFFHGGAPEILLSGAARALVNRYAVAPGWHLTVATVTDCGYVTAFDMHDAGISIAAIVDSRAPTPSPIRDGAETRGIAVFSGAAVDFAERKSRSVTTVLIRDYRKRFIAHVDCDAIAVAGGLLPCLDPRWRLDPGIGIAGSAAGFFSLKACLSSGAKTGVEAALSLGFAPAIPLAIPDAHAFLNTQRVCALVPRKSRRAAYTAVPDALPVSRTLYSPAALGLLPPFAVVDD